MPTPEQTRAFAVYVTGAHSWYKHLGFAPPSPFVFYLDPNAGRAMIHVSDDEVAFVDHTDESEKFHYTWQTTESYRQHFGFWNYEAPYGRSFVYESSEGVVDTAGTGLQILSAEGEWCPIPDRLTHAGTAPLSALMWYPSWRSTSSPPSLGEEEMRICCIFPVSLPFGGVRYAEDCEAIERVLPLLPDDMAMALRSLLTLWKDQSYQRERAETHRALEELYSKAAASNRPWDETLRAGDRDMVWQQAHDAWEISGSRRQECRLLEHLITALDRERQRQIDGMVRAMNQFVEMLQAAGAMEGPLH